VHHLDFDKFKDDDNTFLISCQYNFFYFFSSHETILCINVEIHPACPYLIYYLFIFSAVCNHFIISMGLGHTQSYFGDSLRLTYRHFFLLSVEKMGLGHTKIFPELPGKIFV